MKDKPLPKRKCKNCLKTFQKKRPLDYVCSPKCKTEWERKKEEKKEKPKKFNNIAFASKRKLTDLAIYRPKRDKYISEHKICEVADCNNRSTNLHHKAGRTGFYNEESRLKGIKLLWDERFFMACCHICHPRRIHENPKWSYENNYMIKK